MGMCRGHDPLFSCQLALLSLPICQQCAAHMPPFSIIRKFCIFSFVLGQNFSSQDANLPNFCSQNPSFFKENRLSRAYFWKHTQHTPTKKCWVSPTPSPGFVIHMKNSRCEGYSTFHWSAGCLKVIARHNKQDTVHLKNSKGNKKMWCRSRGYLWLLFICDWSFYLSSWRIIHN